MADNEFVVERFDYENITPEQNDQIKKVYAHAFEHDIGLIFDPSLDRDFTHPLQCYGKDIRGAFFVAKSVKTGEIVGTAGLRPMEIKGFADGTCCEVKRMFILPDGRGNGLAKMKMALIFATAREFGYSRMVLDTKKKLEAANHIYEKYGFTDCDDYNGNPRADRWMALDLTSKSEV